jgi:hypothetical protein
VLNNRRPIVSSFTSYGAHCSIALSVQVLGQLTLEIRVMIGGKIESNRSLDAAAALRALLPFPVVQVSNAKGRT